MEQSRMDHTVVADGTPDNDPAAALHWAAVAMGLAEAREQQGHSLTPDERVTYDRYQAAAHRHGYTAEDIRVRTAELNSGGMWATPRPTGGDA